MRRIVTDPAVTAAPVPPSRLCDHPGCEAGGEFRAPRSRIELNHYYWFCLDHVRSYNAAWNYYAGMSETEIEAEIRRDTVWQRPSWKLGQRHGPAYEARINDPLGLYGKDGGPQQRRNGKHGSDAASRVTSAREQALAVFDLDPPFSQTNLKARYKVLVKLHHPDAHGGDMEAEEKLKIINQAYTTLKVSYFA
jgi:DnaJ-domain-containing protein 1